MGCNCGGSRRQNAAGTWSPAAARADVQEWVVTFPDGSQKVYATDTAAYRAVRMSGGGIQQRAKAKAGAR